VRKQVLKRYFKAVDGIYATRTVTSEELWVRLVEHSSVWRIYPSTTPKRIDYYRYSALCLAAATIDTRRENNWLGSLWQIHRSVRYMPSRNRPGSYSTVASTAGSLYQYQDAHGYYSGPGGLCSRY
jgi:hypothetical protein